MPALPAIQAWIEVDGARLPEYDVQLDAENHTRSCWIPSEEGKHFVVHWQNSGQKAIIGGYVYVDGEFADGKLLMKRKAPKQTSVDGKRLASSAVSPFLFRNITLTDDDTLLLEDEETIHALGCIRLELRRGQNAGRTSYQHEEPKERRPVHEQSKKLGGHRVDYGDTKDDKDNDGAVFRADGDSPPLIFLFYYRPRDVLQAMGKLPVSEDSKREGPRRSIKPEPLELPGPPRRQLCDLPQNPSIRRHNSPRRNEWRRAADGLTEQQLQEEERLDALGRERKPASGIVDGDRDLSPEMADRSQGSDRRSVKREPARSPSPPPRKRRRAELVQASNQALAAESSRNAKEEPGLKTELSNNASSRTTDAALKLEPSDYYITEWYSADGRRRGLDQS